jgi:glycosyltransferase involved in cell wall biosynthesis
MKIALVHNIPGGGAKRALCEQARRLHERGHTLHLYAPFAAVERNYPLILFCEKVWFGDGAAEGDSGQEASESRLGGENGRLRRLAKAILGEAAHDAIRDRFWVKKQRSQYATTDRHYARLFFEMEATGFDVVCVHQCESHLAPSFLLYLEQRGYPTVFYLQDSLRRAHEWPVETPEGYDGVIVSRWREKRRGRIGSRALLDWPEEEAENAATNIRAAARTGIVLVNSFYSREAILRTAGVNARVCYLGVDADFFTPDPAVPREHEVLSVGALRPEKRHDFLLAAVATIPEARRPRLRIVGYELQSGVPGPLTEKLTGAAREKGVDLVIDPDVSDETLRQAYRRAGVFAVAPYLEPFGLVTLEAMACGTAVVGVAEGGVRETVVPKVTGLLTDGDPVAFGAALDAVLTDRAMAEAMGREARRLVCERWTWEQSVDRLEGFLVEAAGRRSA